MTPQSFPEPTSVATLPNDPEPDPRPRIKDEGRRSRKKERTRTELVDAAYDLFAQRGFDETTTIEIADAADVSQRTFFRYFATKEAVLYSDMNELRFDLRREFGLRPTDEPIIESVRHAIRNSVFLDFERHASRRLLQARLAASYDSVSAHFRSVVQAGWEREIIVAVSNRLDVDPMVDPRPEVLAGATMSAMRVATRQWTASGGSEDYLALTVRAFDAIGVLGDL